VPVLKFLNSTDYKLKERCVCCCQQTMPGQHKRKQQQALFRLTACAQLPQLSAHIDVCCSQKHRHQHAEARVHCTVLLGSC
jgi:hypothetical protein